jgi:HSP20 family molecular chaperone IbpA
MAEWNLFADTEALRQEIDRAFEDFGLGRAPSRRVAFLPGREPRRYPLINLLEDKNNVYVEALTSGVDPQSMNHRDVQSCDALGRKGRRRRYQAGSFSSE